MTTPSPIPVAHAPNGNVYDLIAAWALRAGRRRLATWAVGGAADAIGIALVRPGWWLAAAPFVCLASVGAWGLAAQRERAFAAAPPGVVRRRLLGAARLAAVVIGTAAAVAAFYGALWLVFGTRWGPSGG